MSGELTPSNGTTDAGNAWLALQKHNDFVMLSTPTVTDFEAEVDRRKSPTFYQSAIEQKGFDGAAKLMLQGGVFSIGEETPDLLEASQVLAAAAAARRAAVRNMSSDLLEDGLRKARKAEEAAAEQRAAAFGSQSMLGGIPTRVVTGDLQLDMLGRPQATGRVYPSGHPVGMHDTGNYDPGASLIPADRLEEKHSELIRRFELNSEVIHKIPLPYKKPIDHFYPITPDEARRKQIEY